MTENNIQTHEPKLAIVPIQHIQFGERFRQDYGDDTDLVESIKKHGVIQPIAVGLNNDDAHPYILIAGGRRFRACTKAGVENVPVRIFDWVLTSLELRVLEHEENYQRKDLTWQEKDRLIAEINTLKQDIHGKKISTAKDAKGWSQRDTAKYMGVSTFTVAAAMKRVKALDAIPELQKCKTADDAIKLIVRTEEKIIVKELAKRQQAKASTTPLEKQRHDLISRYISGDCFEGMKALPDGMFDVAEIDPPYGIDLKTMKKLGHHGGGRGSLDENGIQDYNEISAMEYPAFITNVLNETFRLLKPTGWVIMWFAPEPWFEVIYRLMKLSGFDGKRLPGSWVKPTGQTKWPERYLANSEEMFFYARKSNGALAKARSSVFNYATVTPTKKVHPTERPIDMITDVLSTFAHPGSKVLVPFLGSGNTILAADNLGMEAIGWDLTSAYRDSYTVKVLKGTPGKWSSY